MKKGVISLIFFFSVQAHAKALNMEAVRKVVRAHIIDVQKCYTELIIEGSTARGKVVLTWNIDDKGAAQDITVKENTSNDQALAGCATQNVSLLVFPAAETGKSFPVPSYPFKFGN